ncbi:MAG: C4-type zinc ribbon domain-containing protein [Campylobacterota bacterium]|nr:C4-type zinc ribbon domain-containing protein [Campylobacterota bacterium]
MNIHLKQLVQLSDYDKQISSFEPRIVQEREKLEVFMQTANELQAKIDEAYKVIDDAKSKRMKNDIHLAELKDKLDDVAKKNSSITNEKELKALQLEEEIAKEQISFANEEIARLDAVVEVKDAQLAESKEKLAAEQDDINEMQTLINTNIEALNQERAEVSEKRAQLVPNIDNKISIFYEKIKRWAKDTVVVPVRKQACYGCFMKINDKTYSEVIRSEEIINCPHCGRILYKEEETA